MKSYPRLLRSLLFMILTSALQAENRTALLMGVGDYKGAPGLSNLPGIKQDLDSMAAKLQELGFKVYIVRNPTLGQAKQAVDDYGSVLRTQKGVGLFYFSGHGAEQSGKNFLIPSGAQIRSGRDLVDEALSAQRVLNRMQESGGGVNMVFLDCCRNEFSKAGPGQGGFAPMQAEGVFIGFATGGDTSAGATQGGSLYTRSLVRKMGLPNISITDMHTLVTKEVKEISANQNPFQYSGLDEIFYLGRVSGSGAAGASTPVVRPEIVETKPREVAPPRRNQGTGARVGAGVDHRGLKARSEPLKSGKASSIYLARYGESQGLVSLQYHSDGSLSGALFIPEKRLEIRLYGSNDVEGQFKMSLWESENPLDGGVMKKSRAENGEIIWTGQMASGKRFQFARETNRKATPSKSSYRGKVGNSPVSVSVDWKSDGSVSGSYRSKASGKTYRLAGDNILQGFLYLDEFTGGVLSARMLLEKSRESGGVTWSGTLYNVDGPRRRVRFSR